MMIWKIKTKIYRMEQLKEKINSPHISAQKYEEIDIESLVDCINECWMKPNNKTLIDINYVKDKTKFKNIS